MKKSARDLESPLSTFQAALQLKGRAVLCDLEDVILNMPWENTLDEEQDILCYGKKYHAMYVVAERVAEGFPLGGSIAIASSLYDVPAVTLFKLWYQQISSNNSNAFITSMRGRKARHQWFLADFDVVMQAKDYIRKSAELGGDDKFTPKKFRDWLNQKLDNHEINRPVTDAQTENWKNGSRISLRQAARYIKQIGFGYSRYKKGQFFDKHDSPENIKARNLYRSLLIWLRG